MSEKITEKKQKTTQDFEEAQSIFQKTFLITGGQGFIGSHIVDELVRRECKVICIDTNLSGDNRNESPLVTYNKVDINDYKALEPFFAGVDGVFHMAAIARTPWCCMDPILAMQTNVMGTVHVLEAARKHKVKRVTLSSSNVVYAAETPYKASKQALEMIAKSYMELYDQSVMCMRYSNVYGPRQREDGPAPNVFAAFRKAARNDGTIYITGDGLQSRQFTHVSDIVRANILAQASTFKGVIDVCFGAPVTMNHAAGLFGVPLTYIPDRPGDIKHIIQDPKPAEMAIGFIARVPLEVGIKDCINDGHGSKQADPNAAKKGWEALGLDLGSAGIK